MEELVLKIWFLICITIGFSSLAMLSVIKKYCKKVRRNTDNCTMYLEEVLKDCNSAILGKKLSDIINQDGDIKTDGEVLDEITELLKKHDLYHERTQ